MKKLAVSTATAIAAFGLPAILATSADMFGGHIQDEWALRLEFLKTVAKIAVWGVCAAATVVNCEDRAIASLLLRCAAIATALCALAALAGLFVVVGYFTTFAMCLIVSLPTLALAALNARRAKRLAARGGGLSRG